MFRRFAFAFLGGLLAASCGGGSSTPTSPSATPTGTVSPSPAPSPTPAPAPSPAPSPSPTPTPTPTPSPSASGASFYVGFQTSNGSPFSVSLAGKTYTSTGPHELHLNPPGQYVAEGTYAGGTFFVTFFSVLGRGGAQSGSMRPFSGPALLTTNCGVAFQEGSGTQRFALAFVVTTDSAKAC